MLRQSDIAAHLFKDDGIHPDPATGGVFLIVSAVLGLI